MKADINRLNYLLEYARVLKSTGLVGSVRAERNHWKRFAITADAIEKELELKEK